MNILLIYDYYSPYPLRQSFADHLQSFSKYSQHKMFYCNYAYGIPNYLSKISFDLIIFHQFFAAQFRWCGLSYEQYTARLEKIKSLTGIKVLLCQDEFFKTESLCRFIREFAIQHVFSVAEPSEWPKIYREIDHSKVRIHKVLTGYIDDAALDEIEKLKKENIPRNIDIGYRAWQAPPWLGKQGKLKVDVGIRVKERAKAKGMKVDIATSRDEGAMFHGLDWYRFMLRCKAFIGVEGGSSLLDEKGEICAKANHFLKQHPKATYEEVEQACFPHLDGNLNLVAISPRHLEACITKTCQILVEGEYSGVLQPGVHYIELKKDFSNLDQVLREMKEEKTVQKIVENAYRDVVLSRRYIYSKFVSELIRDCFDGCEIPLQAKKQTLLFHYNRLREWILFRRIWWEFYLFKKIKKLLPVTFIKWLKSFRNLGSGVEASA